MLADDDVRLTPLSLRRDLLAAGWSPRAVALAVRRGEFARVRHGAYVDAQIWHRMTEAERYALRCRAAFVQARTSVVLSHASALPFLGAPTWGVPLAEVHLTRDDNRAGRREAGVRQHRGLLKEGDVVHAHGISHSSACRAALETMTIARAEAALVVVNHLLHEGSTTLDELRDRYSGEFERWPHSRAANVVLRIADPRIESVGESRLAYLMWTRGVLDAVPQYVVRDGRGTFIARLDFALPELGVWAEFDGRVKYLELLKDGESPTDAVLREKKREERIAAVTGWRCVRVTWDELAEPARVVGRILDAAASVAAQRARADRRPS